MSFFQSNSGIHFKADVNIQKLTIYKVPGHTAMDFTAKGKAYFYSDSLLENDKQKTKFHILPNRLESGVNEVLTFDQFQKPFEGCAVMVWGGKTILQIKHQNFSFAG